MVHASRVQVFLIGSNGHDPWPENWKENLLHAHQEKLFPGSIETYHVCSTKTFYMCRLWQGSINFSSSSSYMQTTQGGENKKKGKSWVMVKRACVWQPSSTPLHCPDPIAQSFSLSFLRNIAPNLACRTYRRAAFLLFTNFWAMILHVNNKVGWHCPHDSIDFDDYCTRGRNESCHQKQPGK